MKTALINIGGEERNFDFGKLWYSKFFAEASKIDPTNVSEVLTSQDRQFDYIVGIVYGGLNCYNKVNSLPLIELSKVIEWVGALEDSEAAAIVNTYTDTIRPKEQGEV